MDALWTVLGIESTATTLYSDASNVREAIKSNDSNVNEYIQDIFAGYRALTSEIENLREYYSETLPEDWTEDQRNDWNWWITSRNEVEL